MKIIHFSDLHIGVENYGRIDPDTGLSTRLNDFLSSFDQVVSYAVAEQVDLVILAGDVYKGRDPSQTHQREFAKRLSTLSSNNIPTFILVGNHDLPNTTTRANAVEIFPTLNVPNVYVGDRLETHLIKTRSGRLQILSVPWPRRGGILSREESKGMSIDEVRQEIESRMTAAIAQQSAALDPNIPAILTAHATVNGATVGTERSMMLGQDHILLVSALQKPQIDYVALGHIHKHQILRKDTPMVVYSGSLERVDFSEELDAKGFCVIDIDPALPQGLRMTDFEFHSVSARPFVSINVEVNDSDLAPNQTICDSISKINIQDSVVRVKIRLSQEMEHLINDRQIRDALNNAHYIAAITKDISNTTRPRITADIADSLDPMEAVELYLQNRDIDKTHRASITQQAQELMTELDNESASID